jgi:FlaG protein
MDPSISSMGNSSLTAIRGVAQSARPEHSSSETPPAVAGNYQPTHDARKTELVVDKSTDRLIVKVFDAQTDDELLAQLPSGTMVAEARQLALTIGALVDVEA